MVVLGLVLVLVAAGLFFAGTRFQARAATILGTTTTSCADLASLATGIGDELGRDAFRRQVELVGRAQPGPAGPLTGPLSNRPVVWYRTQVEHDYWATESRTDAQGRQTSERVRRREAVSDQTNATPFVLADPSGSVAVNPAGIPVDRPLQTHDEFRPENTGGVLGIVLPAAPDTIGYHYREWAVPVDHELYVLAEARCLDDGVMVAKPSEAKARAMISTRSEAELLTSSKAGARWFTIAALALGATGLVLLAVGALS